MKQIEVYICCGAPGSGKSTFSKALIAKDPRFTRICPDDCRRAIGGDSNNQAVSYPAFCMAQDQMQKALAAGQCVVFDATNMHHQARKKIIKLAREYGAKVIAQVFECDKTTLLARNAKRSSEGGRNVGENIIDAMLAKYQRPEVSEFDEVIFN
jgi:predicted kinase